MCSHGFTFGIFGLRQKVACMYIFWIQSHLHPSYKRENKIRSLSHTTDHDLYFIHITFQSILMSTLFYSLTIPSPSSHDKKPASLVFFLQHCCVMNAFISGTMDEVEYHPE